MIGECPSSLKVPSFLQNSIQIQNLPQPHISSAKTEKRVLKTPFLCVFSTLLTSDMFSYFPPKYNNFRLSQSTRNQFVGNSGTWVRIPPRPPIFMRVCRFCKPAFTLQKFVSFVLFQHTYLYNYFTTSTQHVVFVIQKGSKFIVKQTNLESFYNIYIKSC